ncbi:MAG: LUD domain-containing protein [Bacteroidia bacterium]
MQESTSREKVLKKVRSALIQNSQNPYPKLDYVSSVYSPQPDDVPELIFAQRFSEAGGNFIFCENKIEFAESLLNLAEKKKWKEIICSEKHLSDFLNEIEFPHSSIAGSQSPEAVITTCECIVARTGSMLISSANSYGRVLPFFTPVHIVYATTGQIVNDLKDAFAFMKLKYNNELPSSMTFITGPSKTADIEGIVVTGAQGPKELFLFLADEN